jgi:hypothetical protein
VEGEERASSRERENAGAFQAARVKDKARERERERERERKRWGGNEERKGKGESEIGEKWRDVDRNGMRVTQYSYSYDRLTVRGKTHNGRTENTKPRSHVTAALTCDICISNVFSEVVDRPHTDSGADALCAN